MGSERHIDPRDKHRIGPVLTHYGATLPNSTGRWASIKCPFHGDSRASAAVHLEGNAFACYACGIKGDTYAIIMQHEGVKFREALKLAEEWTGQSCETLRSERGFGSRVSGRSRSVLGNRATSRLRSGA